MDLPAVYVIGDSISAQYGPYLEQYLAGTFRYGRKTGKEEALRRLELPESANGGDSSAVLAFLRAMHSHEGIDAEVLLVNCGLHDIKTDPGTDNKQVPLDLYRQNLTAIILTAGEMGLRMVWIRTTPCDQTVHNRPGMAFHRFAADCDAYNAAADQVMAAAGVPAIDLYGFTKALGPEPYCDHVHFHEHIREKQAAYIAGWLCGWYKGQ